MNKTEQLLHMMERPHDYSADEWQEVMKDDECRELYTLMAATRSTLAAEQADDRLTDEAIDAEWQRLKAQHLSTKPNQKSILRHSQFMKAAAAFIGVLLMSGIALAAISIVRQSQQQQQPKATATETTTRAKAQDIRSQAESPDSTAQPRLYDNVALGEMLADLAVHYHIQVVYRNDAASQLRLFYRWKPEYTIEKVVEMLNNFEWLQLELQHDTLFVISPNMPAKDH